MRKLISELRRRNVGKVAAVYVVVGWLVMQVADVMFPALNLPPWTITLVVALVIVGFPVALLLAWAFELTPSGLVREGQPASPGVSNGEPQPALAEAAVAAATKPATPSASTRERRSIAVLPFADRSPGHDHEYFADGLAEELLNALTRVAGLRVPSRTSCFAFKGKDVDVADVAERLHVSHVLEGSVRRADDRVRIMVQLIETSSDTQLWSDTYDRRLDDIFVIQTDIARNVVGALQLRLGPLDATDATTRDPRAYELYLLGLGHFQRSVPKQLHFAIGRFRRAVDIDPAFAKAWAGLASAHSMLAIYYAGGAGNLVASDEASRRAVDLAPDLAEARTARAMSCLARESYDEAAAEFEIAVQSNPRSFEAWYYYARTAVHQGKLDAALRMFEKAAEMDPDDYQGPLIAAAIYRKVGDEAEAVAAERRGIMLAERYLESYPDNARPYFLGTGALYSLGEHDKAFDWAEKAIAMDPGDPSTRYNIACFYAQAGRAERALDYLEGSIASRSWIENDPELDPIRDHPRFQAYLRSLQN